MATSQLLLVQPVEGLGDEGDQVTVRAGYARNYLLPRKIAVPVTRANRKQMEVLKLRAEQRRAKELEGAQKVAARLETINIAFAVKTGPGGKMFGSVTAQDLIDRLAEEGVQLDRKQLSLYSPVKTLGKHETTIKLHAEVSVDFAFEVVSENPIEEDGEGETAAAAPAENNP
ncbi:MAG: 50S ribosomal protein L9 [Opitutales bacterium]|nr:50S ribosomal protein L9 [Opitutales bacterium]